MLATGRVRGPAEDGMRSFRLLRTSKYKGLDPRGLIEPTQFVLVDDEGRPVYTVAASSAWWDYSLSIRDAEGNEVGRLVSRVHKPKRNYKLVRSDRREATIAYKDPVLRWRDRYVIRTRGGEELEAVQTAVGSGVYEVNANGRVVARFTHHRLELDEAVDPLLIVSALVVDALPRG